MEHEFPLGIFRPENWQDHLFRCSVAPGNFPMERLEKQCSIWFPAGFSGKLFVNGKQPVIPVRNKTTPKDSVASQLFKTSFTDLIWTLWVAKNSCSRNKVTPSCNWSILYKFQLTFTHGKFPQTFNKGLHGLSRANFNFLIKPSKWYESVGEVLSLAES